MEVHDTEHIDASLRHLATPLASLEMDVANARAHDARSVDAIAASLQRFGQQKPCVSDAHGIVRAGNGMLLAARKLGWSHLAVVRSSLTGTELVAYGIADNRLGELSRWDNDALIKVLTALQDQDFPLPAIGYDDVTVAKLLENSREMPLPDEENGNGQGLPDGVPASHVRMQQLFLTADTFPVFQEHVVALMQAWGTETLTDTVLEAVRRAAVGLRD